MSGIFSKQSTAFKPRYIPKIKKHEEAIQKQVCSYLRMQYPHIIFRSDYASGLHLTVNQSRIHASLQSGRSFPDLFIYEPRLVAGVQYAGLAIELKRDGVAIVVSKGARKGHIVANSHIQEQVIMARELKKRGYYATICCGFDEAVKVISWYFGKHYKENAKLF